MKPTRVTLALVAAAVAVVASGCGGSGDVPEGAVAVVGGTEIPRSELDEILGWQKKYYTSSKQEFPKAGSPEYQSLQNQDVAFLVQVVEFEQAAEELGIEVTEKDVDAQFDEVVKTRYDGNRKRLADALEEQGLSESLFRKTLRNQVLSQKLFDEVTKDVAVPDSELLAYYTQNQAQYPDTREVQHILIAEKGTGEQVDYAKSKAEAERIYQQLKSGADFAALAKKYSDDDGTKDSGGKYTAVRGQTVPEFEKAAFGLKTGAISPPVKTQFGYHVIKAASDVKKTSFDQVKEAIRASLLQQKRNAAMTTWVEDLRKRYESKVAYAAGLEPPEIPTTPTETQ